MKIGLDFDGVISDCGKLKSEGSKRLWGVSIPPAKFKKEIVVGENLLTATQYRELQKIIYETREVGFLMEPVPGMLDFLPKLIAQGHDVWIVTSRDKAGLAIAKEWSQQQGLSLNFIGVGYGKSKAPALRGFDVYLDDDLDKLQPLVGIVPNLYLFSWGYNIHVEIGGIGARVATWDAFYLLIQRLEVLR